MKSDGWKPGDQVMNLATSKRAHFLRQIGFDSDPSSFIEVLPFDGFKAGDEEQWKVWITKRIGGFYG